jgi:hypothetical protein
MRNTDAHKRSLQPYSPTARVSVLEGESGVQGQPSLPEREVSSHQIFFHFPLKDGEPTARVSVLEGESGVQGQPPLPEREVSSHQNLFSFSPQGWRAYSPTAHGI